MPQSNWASAAEHNTSHEVLSSAGVYWAFLPEWEPGAEGNMRSPVPMEQAPSSGSQQTPGKRRWQERRVGVCKARRPRRVPRFFPSRMKCIPCVFFMTALEGW